MPTVSLNTVREYLNWEREAMRSFGHAAPDGYVYDSLRDFVAREGIDYGPGSPLPEGVARMPAKECFANALLTAAEHGLTYVEGWALGVIPVHHAWCVDEAGRVIDPTWAEPGSDYCGVPMALDYVDETTDAKGTYGVLDWWQERWPILRQPWDPVARRPKGEA